MKYLFNHLPEIEKRMDQASGILLMIDFDGTLSPLAPTPAQAFLPKDIKRELQKCSQLFPVAIVSGRSLKNIKNKVGLKNLIYAGNHGLEWQVGKRISRVPTAKEVAKSLAAAKQKLKKIRLAYTGTLLEDKQLSLAFHYRRLNPALVAGFKKDVAKAVKMLTGNGSLRVLKGKKTIELRPNIDWNKGKFVIFIHKCFQNKFKRKLLPMYLGNDATDEDAFFALKSGITIRVGRSKATRAKYYINNIGQVKLFIHWLLKSFNSLYNQF